MQLRNIDFPPAVMWKVIDPKFERPVFFAAGDHFLNSVGYRCSRTPSTETGVCETQSYKTD
jgi:hypothetical protein